MTVEPVYKKKRESIVPGLRRKEISTFGNPETTVPSPIISKSKNGALGWILSLSSTPLPRHPWLQPAMERWARAVLFDQQSCALVKEALFDQH